MKNTHACPKCGCTDLYEEEDTVYNSKWAIIVSMFKSVRMHRLVCLNCGYAEQYVARPEDLEVLAAAKRKG